MQSSKAQSPHKTGLSGADGVLSQAVKPSLHSPTYCNKLASTTSKPQTRAAHDGASRVARASALRASAMCHGVAKMRGRYGHMNSDAGGAASSFEVAALRRDKHGEIICIHNARLYYCKTCGGKVICQHDLRRDKCRECKCAAAASRLKNASRHEAGQSTFGRSLRLWRLPIMVCTRPSRARKKHSLLRTGKKSSLCEKFSE